MKRSNEPLRVGYVGRLADDKNARQLVPFWKQLSVRCPDMELWVAGEGKYEREVRKLESESNGRVKYYGRLTRAQLYESFYPQLNMVVSFSPSEGWPNGIAEAMAHGVVPVLAPYRGIFTDKLAVDGINARIFPADRMDSAAEITAKLAQDSSELCRLSSGAEKTAAEFTNVRLRRTWSDCLEHCLQVPLADVRKPQSLFKRGKWGIREKHWEVARRLLRKRFLHQHVGEEWPSFDSSDAEFSSSIALEMCRIEREASQQVLPTQECLDN